ncbi:hypothetical protein MBGDC06_00741, partial [Thermoplasmatales archaeon SCGC AB-539-C06]
VYFYIKKIIEKQSYFLGYGGGGFSLVDKEI